MGALPRLRHTISSRAEMGHLHIGWLGLRRRRVSKGALKSRGSARETGFVDSWDCNYTKVNCVEP
jgi:hypothetical protein